jgi:hypothetical protein
MTMSDMRGAIIMIILLGAPILGLAVTPWGTRIDAPWFYYYRYNSGATFHLPFVKPVILLDWEPGWMRIRHQFGDGFEAIDIGPMRLLWPHPTNREI